VQRDGAQPRAAVRLEGERAAPGEGARAAAARAAAGGGGGGGAGAGPGVQTSQLPVLTVRQVRIRVLR